MNFPAIYLASRSPRRRELLQQMGVDFAVLDVTVDETPFANELPAQYVTRVARDKALAGWQTIKQTETRRAVLAADTSVVIGQHILGKPGSDDEAKSMLKRLSGTTHQVMTAVTLLTKTGNALNRLSVSDVTFAHLSAEEIDAYIATGEGRDKAGSYAVQGLAALFIEKISGSYSGIMGLPIHDTGQLLNEMESQREQ